jgi:hypothetical protein
MLDLARSCHTGQMRKPSVHACVQDGRIEAGSNGVSGTGVGRRSHLLGADDSTCADLAEWAGNSVKVLLDFYAKCLDGGVAAALHRISLALGVPPPGQPKQ